MNKDQIKGQARKLKGAIKEKTGKLFGSSSMEDKGATEHSAGKVQQGYGDVKQDVKEMKEIKDRI